MKLIDSLVQGAKKYSPEILVGAGVVGVVVGTVMACKATRKIDPIIEEHTDELTDIRMSADTGIKPDKETGEGLPYTEKDKRRDITRRYGKTALSLAKLYLPAGLVITGSIVCILKSHKILSDRNLGLAAAYAGATQAFEEYRKNIVAKYGQEADTEARYSVEAKKNKKENTVEYEATDGIKEIDHSRLFDAESRVWDKDRGYNLRMIHSAEQKLNSLLLSRKSHTVTLNEVYAELDLRPSADGQVLGYRYDPERDKDTRDEYGIPTIIQIMHVLVYNGKHVMKSTDELRTDDSNRYETVMVLDFPGLVRIV